MRKIMSLLLALVLLVSIAMPATAEEAPTLRIAVLRDVDDKSTSFADKPILQEASKATGINIEWDEIPSTFVGDRVPVMLGSGELPDVFLGLLSTAQVTQNAALFVALNDYVRDDAPNMCEFFDRYGSALWDQCTYTDGNIYSLVGGFMNSPGNDATSLPFINTVWLENLGLEVPTTLDEYVDVLRAFKEQDANGNGDSDDEIPLSFCNNYYASIFKYMTGNFGFTGYYAVRDGVVTAVAKDDSYREMLEFYHQLYEEGLMDPEGFTQTEAQFKAKLQSGVVGVWYGWRPGVELAGSDYTQSYFVFNPPQTEEAAQYPALDGQTNKFIGNPSVFVVTTACKDVSAALKWWDFFYSSDEIRYTALKGMCGHYWDVVDGVCLNINKIDPDNLGNAYWQYTYGLGNAGPVAEILPYAPDKVLDPFARDLMSAVVRDNIPKYEEAISNKMAPAEFLNQKSEYESSLLSFIDHFTADAVVNGVDDESWAEYLMGLETYRYDEWIEWNQNYYDGNF